MQSIVLIVHVLVAICVTALVLVQHGKGADAGAAFGSGSSSTMFGSQGPMPFLMKLTALFAFVFFVTSITLSYMATHFAKSQAFLSQQTVMEQPSETQKSSVVLDIPANKGKSAAQPSKKQTQ